MRAGLGMPMGAAKVGGPGGRGKSRKPGLFARALCSLSVSACFVWFHTFSACVDLRCEFKNSACELSTHICKYEAYKCMRVGMRAVVLVLVLISAHSFLRTWFSEGRAHVSGQRSPRDHVNRRSRGTARWRVLR
jgi:hypothetical protein